MGALHQAADIIAPHVSSDHRREERAEDAAGDLDAAGLFTDSDREPAVSKNWRPVEAATHLLQCRFSWPVAERIAAELAAAGLLREEA